ncbi:MAG TPA: T9SS type A sorting domain-containing protein, partial [bacterium]|nr:T9SS type A sorting domain-containing protein [bacterium]
DGGVWRSTDTGDTWLSRREGINTYQFYDICVAQSDPTWLMGGSQDNGVNGPESGQSWFTSNLFADGMVCNVHPTNAATVYAESQFGNQMKSTDSGGSWVDIQNGIPVDGGFWVTPVAMDPNDPATLFASLDSTTYRTTDGGASWTNQTGFAAFWIDVSPTDGDYVWAVDFQGVIRSTDGGDAWSAAAPYGFGVGSETKIAADPALLGGALVAFASFDSTVALVARTTDLGATWTDVTGDLPAQPVNTLIVDPSSSDDWYIGTDTGVWRSTNGGVNWTPFDDGLPNAVVMDLEIRDSARKLVCGTYGRGAWETDLPSVGLGVAAVTPPSRDLMLDPPIPNPVRGAARFRFAARHEGPATLSVYDVRGRRIARVARIPRGDGLVREVVWQADDVPAGVYFAVLQAGEERRARKVVVTR